MTAVVSGVIGVLVSAPVGAQGGSGGTELTGPIPASEGDGQAPPYLPKDVATQYGYVEEEFFVSGDATSYVPVGALGSDGRWEVAPAGTAPYTTRVKVRRPKDMKEWSGNIAVEWNNVTGGIDVDPDFGLTYPVLAGRGDVHVAVSAQAISVNEGPGLDLGLPGAPSPEDTAPLRSRDPVRYVLALASRRRLFVRHRHPGRKAGARASSRRARSPSTSW